MSEEDNGVTPFPFATVDELRKRWKGMPDGIEEEVQVALEDASQFILDIAPAARKARANTRRRIVCAAVKRSMDTPEESVGVSQLQMGAGPYQQSRSFANPHGDFYLTKLEKKALGVTKQRAGEVDMLAGSRRAHQEYDDAR